MRDPAFWWEENSRSRRAAPLTRLLLRPLSALYTYAGARRIRNAQPYKASVPVVCIGNLTLGGAGKTPIAAVVRQTLSEAGFRAATLSRGYGGTQAGPLQVAPDLHSFTDVGDEPLLLAKDGPAFIARDRVAGAKAIVAAGLEAIILDDGHQNPSLHKDLGFVVIDTARAFGNRMVFPAGPLREPVAVGLARASAVILMGDAAANAAFARSLPFEGPILSAELTPLAAPPAGKLVAFAGIGRPAKVFNSLRAAGADVVDSVSFADHHPYTAADLASLLALAREHEARLITTAKDAVRLPRAFAAEVDVWQVAARFHQPEALTAVLACLQRTVQKPPL
jgi:tetraacyldisaccharide 4'-kinase